MGKESTSWGKEIYSIGKEPSLWRLGGQFRFLEEIMVRLRPEDK